MAYSILLVEDDERMANMIQLYLKQEGWTVSHIQNGLEAVDQFSEINPSLLILDIMLPGIDGIEICRRVRQTSMLPILMLTARQSDVDKAMALGIGADDYLSKPFSTTELIARIRALLRRAYEFNQTAQTAVKQIRTLGGPRMRLYPEEHQITFDGLRIELTPLEFGILQQLMEAPGWVFNRGQLLQTVWGYSETGVGEETVTVHINNMRQKLGDGGRFIRTVRGVGYAYEEPKDSSVPSALK